MGRDGRGAGGARVGVRRVLDGQGRVRGAEHAEARADRGRGAAPRVWGCLGGVGRARAVAVVSGGVLGSVIVGVWGRGGMEDRYGGEGWDGWDAWEERGATLGAPLGTLEAFDLFGSP